MNKFKLLGESLGHSLSPLIHEVISRKLGIESEYKLLELGKSDLKDALNSLKLGENQGFNVTIPYKTEVLKFEGELSKEARLSQASNTISSKNGKLYFDNTDIFGFKKMLKKKGIEIRDREFGILGYGGAARAVIAALRIEGAKKITVFTRKNKDYLNNNEDITEFLSYQNIENNKYRFDALINTTPLGMGVLKEMNPLDLFSEKSKNILLEDTEAFVDLIYNPSETLFLLSAKKHRKKTENGLSMLIYQAIKSQEIWNDIKLDEEEEDNIFKEVRESVFRKAIILIGMPTSGKSTILKKMRDILDNKIECIDLDEEIERREGMSIPSLFSISENHFREAESRALREILSSPTFKIISSGGGTIVREENRELIKEKCDIVLIERDEDLVFSTLLEGNRPLLKKPENYRKLKNERQYYYRELADIIINNNESAEKSALTIIKKLNI